uniref:Uncharacterized protein n=1 Tax=Manihot esculenta TaxID=3983 RepID=A0A2C9VK95_MANES
MHHTLTTTLSKESSTLNNSILKKPINEHQQEKFQDEVEEFELFNEENLEEACYQDYFMTVHGYQEQEDDKLEHAGDDSDMTNINPRSEHKISNSEAREKAEGEDFWSKYPRLNESLKLEQFSEYTLPDSGVNIIKERLISIGNLKAKELEDKWKKLQVAETEVKLMRANLIQQQTQLILDLIS